MAGDTDATLLNPVFRKAAETLFYDGGSRCGSMGCEFFEGALDLSLLLNVCRGVLIMTP